VERGCLPRLLPALALGAGPLPRCAASEPGAFAVRSSDDAQLHAALVHAIYAPNEQRRGAVAFFNGGTDDSAAQNCWYAYVGGDEYRGFWYCTEKRHLVLAERGTAGGADDWLRDACIAAGTGLAAVSGRARVSKAELQKQVQDHHCSRVTLAGHSLGGAVAAFTACSAPRGLCINAAHIFNPGGLPDLTRYMSCSLASVDIIVHRICGDPVSVAFLPFLQTQYLRRSGYEEVDSHRMVHFL